MGIVAACEGGAGGGAQIPDEAEWDEGAEEGGDEGDDDDDAADDDDEDGDEGDVIL